MTNKLAASRLKPILLVLTATLLFSIGAPIGKITSSSPFVLTFFRCLTGLIVFAIVHIIKGRGPLFIVKSEFIIGGALYASTSICFYIALNYTTAANVTVLGNTSPFFLAILGFLFLHEKPLNRDWIILLLIMSGIFLCFKSGLSFKGARGDLLSLLAGFLFSILVVILKKCDSENTMQPLIWGSLIASIATLPALFSPGAIILKNIPFFIILGIFQMAIPFFLYAKGQQSMGAMEASLFKLLEPVAATIWTALLVGEIPTLYSIIGGVLVIAALFCKTFLEYRNSLK